MKSLHSELSIIVLRIQSGIIEVTLKLRVLDINVNLTKVSDKLLSENPSSIKSVFSSLMVRDHLKISR